MTRVGVRELKQNASAVLRLVASGQTVEVTDRGRPVARIVPIAPGHTLDQLIDEGRAVAASGDLLEIAPLERPAGAPALSGILEELRADER